MSISDTTITEQDTRIQAPPLVSFPFLASGDCLEKLESDACYVPRTLAWSTRLLESTVAGYRYPAMQNRCMQMKWSKCPELFGVAGDA